MSQRFRRRKRTGFPAIRRSLWLGSSSDGGPCPRCWLRNPRFLRGLPVIERAPAPSAAVRKRRVNHNLAGMAMSNPVVTASRAMQYRCVATVSPQIPLAKCGGEVEPGFAFPPLSAHVGQCEFAK